MKMPLIWINKREKSMGSFRNMDQLTTATKSALKKGGFYDNLQLVAPNGDNFIVNGVEKEYVIDRGKLKTILWKIIGGELYRVKLNLVQKGKIDLPSLLQSVIQIIEADEEFWDSDGQLEQFLIKAHNSNSVEDLVKLLDKKYNSELISSE
jgi:hypothetical protein